MLDADRLRQAEHDAVAAIRRNGWRIIPFGLGYWTLQDEPLGLTIGAMHSALAHGPDAIADSRVGVVLVDFADCRSGGDTRAVTMAKLVAAGTWSLIAPWLLLDVSTGRVWRYDETWPYLMTGGGGARTDPARKAFAWLSRIQDEPFSDYWPERHTP